MNPLDTHETTNHETINIDLYCWTLFGEQFDSYLQMC